LRTEAIRESLLPRASASILKSFGFSFT